MMPLYSQGYSLARYLVAQGGKRKFLELSGRRHARRELDPRHARSTTASTTWRRCRTTGSTGCARAARPWMRRRDSAAAGGRQAPPSHRRASAAARRLSTARPGPDDRERRPTPDSAAAGADAPSVYELASTSPAGSSRPAGGRAADRSLALAAPTRPRRRRRPQRSPRRSDRPTTRQRSAGHVAASSHAAAAGAAPAAGDPGMEQAAGQRTERRGDAGRRVSARRAGD